MSNYYEAMDVDDVPVNSEDKEIAVRDNGPGAPTDGGFEGLDISEMNMRLRMSCTPIASPAPRTNRFIGSAKKLLLESGDSDSLNLTVTNSSEIIVTEWSMGDHNANHSSEDPTSSTINAQSEDTNKTTMLQSTNSKISIDCITNNNDTITFDKSYNGENLSNTLPVEISQVSTLNKDEELPKPTSPILRGLKSVINMFRPSQSPIVPSYSQNAALDPPKNRESPATAITQEMSSSKSLLVSTPVHSDSDSKRLSDQPSFKGISPHSGDSLVFNDDIINELQWNDDSTIIFNRNKMSCQKLYTLSNSSSDSRYSGLSAEINRDEAEAKEIISLNKASDTTVEHINITMNYSNSKCSPHMFQISVADDADDNGNKSECIRGIVDNVLDSVFETAEIFVNESCGRQTLKEDNTSALDTLFSLHIVKPVLDPVKNIESDEQNIIKYSEQSAAANTSNIFTSERNESEIKNDSIDSVTVVTNFVNGDKYNESGNIDTLSKNSKNDTYNNEIMVREKELRSENNSLYISVNIAHEENISDLPPITNDADLDMDSMENLTARKAMFSVSPPSTNTVLSEIYNPFLSRPRVTMSPPRNKVYTKSIKHNVEQTKFVTYENIDQVQTSSSEITQVHNTELYLTKDNDFQEKNITSKYDDTFANVEVQHVTINSAEYKYFEEQLHLKEGDNFGINLDLISNDTPSGMELVQNVDSQEQSDAYLSADSGRESEHLLDNELDLIDKNTENHVYEDSLETDTQHLENETGCVSPNENKKQSNLKTSLVIECENPFTTKTNICVSPNPTYRNSIKVVKSEPVTDLENLLSKKPTIVSPVSHNNRCTDVETAKSPFITKSNLCISPSLVHENNIPIPETKDNIISEPKLSIHEEYYFNDKDHVKTECSTKLKSDLLTSPPSVKLQPRAKAKPNNEYEIKSDIHKLTEINFDSIENPFAKKNRISSSPVRSNFDDSDSPFATKSKIAISPPTSPSFISSFDQMNKFDNAFTNNNNIRITPSHPKLLENNKKQMSLEKVSLNEDNSTNPNVELDKTYNIKNNVKESENDLANSSGSSNSSGINTTIKEVKSEDEDTLEGPDFVDLEVKMENPFDTKSERILSVINKKTNKDNKNTKIIQCSDLVSKKSTIDDLPSEHEAADMFINADAFDFLMNRHTIANTDNGKESLFLKFDPLCAQKSLVDAVPNDVNGKIKNVMVCQPEITDESPEANTVAATPPKPVKTSTQSFSSVANFNTTKDVLNTQPRYSNSTPPPPEKPMMAVMPAVNNEPTINARSSPYTPTRSERRSMTFASPAIAAIDRLITLSGNNSPVNQTYFADTTAMNQDTREAMVQVQELLAQKDIEVDQLKQENSDLQDKLTELEIQIKSMQDDNNERLTKIDDLKSKLSHKSVLNNNMSAAVEQYERAIASMIAENEQEKQKHERERSDLIRERDEQVAHLSSMEISFSDLHTKYERTKQLIITFKSNEESLRRTIDEYKASQQKFQNNYETLKQQAITKMNNANIEMDKLKRSHEAEVVKLTAQVKRKELHATSLEESLAQKIKANEELTAICDELISKVG